LSHVKPQAPVTTDIKEMLAEVGIDTDTFKAYSVRRASSLAALRKVVHISDILQTADWSKDSTFKWFDFRPVANDGCIELTVLYPCICIVRSMT